MLKLTTDKHEASCGFSAIAELLVSHLSSFAHFECVDDLSSLMLTDSTV